MNTDIPSHLLLSYTTFAKRTVSGEKGINPFANVKGGKFHGLMIVIATGFIPLPPLSIVWRIVTWESKQWLKKNIVQSTG